MKTPGGIWRKRDGAVIIFALVVVLVGTIVLAAWVQLLSSRAAYSDTAFDGAKRRVSTANGRMLARQFILEVMPSGAITNTNASGSIAGGWGGFSITGGASGFWTNTNFVNGNFFNPMDKQTYAVTFTGSISGSTGTDPWSFRVRSRSPFAGGYPLVIHATASTNLVWAPTTNILWTNVNGFAGMPVLPMTSGTNSSGGGTNGYAGYFAAPVMTNVTATAISYNTYTNATNNTIELILSPTNTSTVLRFTVSNTITASSTNRFTNNARTQVYSNGIFAITAIRIIGAAGTNMLHVVVPAASTNLSTLRLSGTNTRPTYVNRAGGSMTVSTTNFTGGAWRLCLSLSNTPLTVLAPTGTNLVIQGGIRTDQSISVNSGTLSVIPDTPPGLIESIGDRILWLEENRTP